MSWNLILDIEKQIINHLQILQNNQQLSMLIQTDPAHFSVFAVVVLETFGKSTPLMLITQLTRTRELLQQEQLSTVMGLMNTPSVFLGYLSSIIATSLVSYTKDSMLKLVTLLNCIFKVVLHISYLYHISSIVLISFTGYASAVTNISVIQLNSTSLQLQFQPSYALDDTVSVDYYIIEVTGVGNYYMSILNSSSTVVTVLMTDPCTCYIISVTPHNDVGLGEKIIETDVIVFQGLS